MISWAKVIKAHNPISLTEDNLVFIEEPVCRAAVFHILV